MASRMWQTHSAKLGDLGGLPRCYLQTYVGASRSLTLPLVGVESRSSCKSDAREKAWPPRRSNDTLSAAAALFQILTPRHLCSVIRNYRNDEFI